MSVLSVALRVRPRLLPHGALRSISTAREYTHILTARPEPAVALLTLNRPKALNALSSPLFEELNHALEEADADDSISAIVLTGSKKAFAGAFLYTCFCQRSHGAQVMCATL